MAGDTKSCYDGPSDTYHLIFKDWDASIRGKQQHLARSSRENVERRDVRILDCACGIGAQWLGLAGLGFRMTGCDLSDRAVDLAGLERKLRGLEAELFTADMRDFVDPLAHLGNDRELAAALTQIRGKLRTGGLFMASLSNYDKLIQERPTVQGPVFYGEQGKRRIVHQLWDWIDSRIYIFRLDK